MKITVDFAPGCFDDFEGSQEELDRLIAEITKLAESGQLFQNLQETDEIILPKPKTLQ